MRFPAPSLVDRQEKRVVMCKMILTGQCLCSTGASEASPVLVSCSAPTSLGHDLPVLCRPSPPAIGKDLRPPLQ